MATTGNSIGRWVSVLYRYGQSFLDRELKMYSISSGQYIFLIILLKRDGMRQEELSRVLNIDKATTARAVKKLEAAGYVRRTTDPRDKRARVVYVTNKAVNIQPVLEEISDKWTDMVTSGFTEEEKKMVIDLMKRLSINAASVVKD
ncbi:MarR family transcriptional regulator [Metallumcola ferriviriculae]|uniref:MarR family transcriptional regulator n=1 Tax=Metallumcola ferriviriculae TaxID=3039180 RepID=A0AAU0UTA2_9FIRM|nr:MarR family transcriptional regulator [Desulfitibacteraceae bacterium MK1]